MTHTDHETRLNAVEEVLARMLMKDHQEDRAGVAEAAHLCKTLFSTIAALTDGDRLAVEASELNHLAHIGEQAAWRILEG